MGLDLTNQYVDETYQKLIQLSGSNQITDGTGSLVTDLDINVSTAVSASYATTASYAENANVDSGSWDGQYTGSADIKGRLQIDGTDNGPIQEALEVRGGTETVAVIQALATGSGVKNVFQGAHVTNGFPNATLGFQFDATDINAVKPQIYFDDNGNGSEIVSEGNLDISSTSGVARLNGTASYADRAAIADTATTASHALYAEVANIASSSLGGFSDNTIVYGKNLSGGEILKGTPLYFTGSGTNGNIVGVYPADAANPLRMPAAGVAGETIANEAEGVVFLDGFLSGVDTSGFQSGQQVYVGVGGGYQATRPTGSNVLVQGLGYIEKVHPSNGSGVIRGAGRVNDVPNIQQGYAWVGGPGDVAITVPTSSIAGDSFPYTGSAGISGSLNVVGPITAENFGTISLTGDNPGINRNIIDSTGADFTVIRSDSGIEIDNRAGTGSVSVYTNGNMQFEPQGDLDFYTPTGNINLTGNRGILTTQDTLTLTSNTTNPFQGVGINAPNVRITLSDTGSGAGDFALSAPGGGGGNTPGMLLSLGTGSYGSNPTVANMLFTGDDAFFSAVGNFYIKNVYNDTGSITVWSESELELRGDTGVTISGDSFSNPNDPIEINIKGSTTMDSFTSGIMAFQPQIGTYTRVTQFQRAFVETPLTINAQGTVEVQTGATLKVINEL